MSLLMTLAELENECLARGLNVEGSGKNGKLMKDDYIQALQNWSIDGLRSQGMLLPGRAWTSLNLRSPMLAQSQKAFKTDKLFQEFVGRDDVVAEIKQDGCRMLISFTPGVGFELYSRNRSVSDFLFGSYTDQVYGWQRDVTENVLPFSFIIDGELISLNPSVNGHVVTENVLSAVVAMLGMNQMESYRMQAEAGYPLRFEAFDCIMYSGQSIMDEPLKDRKKILHSIVSQLHEVADKMSLPQLKWIEEVSVVSGTYDEKYNFFKKVVDQGGEGLVLKTLNSPYNPVEARGGMGGGWIKMKRNTSMSVGSDLDAFISGAVPGSGEFEGLVGSLVFSVYLLPSGQVHELCRVSGLSDEVRRAVTATGTNGEVILNPTWQGRVAAVQGQDVSSRSRSLAHARILRWRDGADSKFPAQCVLQESVLNDMIL